MATKRHISKGNVFEDIGFTSQEAAVLAMRVELALVIEKYIKQRKMTQTAAAKFFGVGQPEVSKILRRNFTEISLEKLVRLAAKTGKTPRVTMVSGRSPHRTATSSRPAP
jgi:predicted XRE-type DNA-binding protein